MHFLLSVLRFSLCAWVGAATLFVITGIREVTAMRFEPATKNHLAAVRFPAYYFVGFLLVGIAVLCAVALRSRFDSRTRGTTIVVLLTVVVLLMVGDWFFVFNPLLDLMDLPGARDKPEFTSYHKWSKYLNFASIGLCLVTAVLALRETGLNQNRSPDENSKASA
jgi:hypothetical protein